MSRQGSQGPQKVAKVLKQRIYAQVLAVKNVRWIHYDKRLVEKAGRLEEALSNSLGQCLPDGKNSIIP